VQLWYPEAIILGDDMALLRARLPLIAWGSAILLSIGASAQAGDTTTMTMQQLQGKNLLWLSANSTTCPTGYTLVNVQTSTGIKKACVASSTTSTSSMQSTSTMSQ
jgi:hypothetical protein